MPLVASLGGGVQQRIKAAVAGAALMGWQFLWQHVLVVVFAHCCFSCCLLALVLLLPPLLLLLPALLLAGCG
jgi:hypothetical protein